MPRTIGGLVGFVVIATITVIVGSFVYAKVVSPLIAQVFKKAA